MRGGIAPNIAKVTLAPESSFGSNLTWRAASFLFSSSSSNYNSFTAHFSSSNTSTFFFVSVSLSTSAILTRSDSLSDFTLLTTNFPHFLSLLKGEGEGVDFSSIWEFNLGG
ncbi:unnamed protein product [Linum trigynum]|uniref:Uncharacterized protein n=1 Tax=Linum trigynum TaxID=586398 RepID=A0AAV2E820_9ROSI